MNEQIIYTTQDGVDVIVKHGTKSEKDFIVKYQEPGKRKRTPKHIHLVVDIFSKKTGNEDLTNRLLDEIIRMIDLLEPAKTYPPRLQYFENTKLKPYQDLNNYGQYSIEFVFVVIELIMIQEKTNYPDGTLNRNLFSQIRNDADIFSIVSTATFR